MLASSEEKLLTQLSVLFGADLTTDAGALLHYGKDWSTQYRPDPLAVVFPRSTDQLRDLLLLANRARLGLVPSGGRTGLSGGAVASGREVVVSMERMNRIVEFNALDRTVLCEAGVVTKQLQDFAVEQGFYYPVDFASAASSQLGGNIATNAGGIKVMRYGLTRDWVAGLQVVTGTGEVLELNQGLIKNATGYDLRHLFIGSEGTLGFITQARMRLTRPPKALSVMVLAVPRLDVLMRIAELFQAQISLSAFEFFSEPALQQVLAHAGGQRPCSAAPFYALLEFESESVRLQEQATELFASCLEQGWVLDGTLSQTEAQARSLWRLRENISASIAPRAPYKNDLAVRPSQVPDFLAAIDELVARRYPDFEIIWYGHIGDGNLHLNILRPPAMAEADFVARCGAVNQEVFELVQRFGGSISAEHGVGLLKRDYLGYSRSPTEIGYLRQLKKLFDPNGILNPGKLLL